MKNGLSTHRKFTSENGVQPNFRDNDNGLTELIVLWSYQKKIKIIIDQLIPSKILISSNFAQENLIPPKRNILCDEYVPAKLDKRRESKIAPFQ